MNTKLTLSLDRDIIEQAKEFAQSQHQSLSKLIEGYLRQVTRAKDAKLPVTPIVASLSGVLDAGKIGDHKHEYANYLAEKYR
jgi:dsDNA-specific endonuclease/ATPase MutS2